MLQIKEDPLRPGYFYATTAPEFGTPRGGADHRPRRAQEGLNADNMQVDYVTAPLSGDVVGDGQTPPAGHPGHFRNPVPLSDGTLLAVRTTSPYADRASGGLLSSRYDFHLMRLQSGAPYWRPGRD